MMKQTRKSCVAGLLLYLVLAVAFRWIAGDTFAKGIASSGEMVTENAVVGELLPGNPVSQTFVAPCDQITNIAFLATNYGREVSDTLEITLLDENAVVLAQTYLDTAGLPDGSVWTAYFDNAPFGYQGKTLTLEIVSLYGVTGNAVSIYCGNMVNMGKYEIEAQPVGTLAVNGVPTEGMLCFQVIGETRYTLANCYWYVILAVFAVLCLVCFRLVDCEKRGKSHFLLRVADGFRRYHFLLRQLVSRDFKTKYKRSVLGVLWSLMNPLLTMLVMYIVFSTLFKSNISNFPVYLLIGIVCWNFFNETVGSCLTSVTGNAALITKVYVPKYMYPLSRTMSCMVNLGMSLIPLMLVLILTRTQFTIRYLLLPFPLICLFLFSFGVGLLLASLMVFFRDTQFLWGVVSMLWMYLTPIFYDTSIIPEEFMVLYKMNPLYHIIRIMRVLLIEGNSPEPKAYLLCMVASAVPLLLGMLAFKKSQDRFVLYL